MKRTAPFDPDYIVQGCYSDSRVCESDGSDNEAEAVKLALDMLKSLYFEGDYVVVMSRDGELVYDSRQNLSPDGECLTCGNMHTRGECN